MTVPTLPPEGNQAWYAHYSAIHAAVTTGVGLTVPSHTHGAAQITAGGTKNATTYLRGDNVWALPASLQQEGLVLHDGTAGGGTRPTGFLRVRWVGGTARPTNMFTNDVWEHNA